MQIILQATHGVVSGAPQFFKRAFGESDSEFHDLLLWPHKFTFNRNWYEKSDGKAEFSEFKAKLARISDLERAELLWLVSSSDPRYFKDLPQNTKSKQLREILNFYVPLAKEDEAEIWRRQRSASDSEVPDDERVEDAGLLDNVLEFPVTTKKSPSPGRLVHV
jgi:hypothetical protein